MAKGLGRGSKLYYGDTGSATNFIKIPQLRQIGEIRSTSARVEMTELESTAHEYTGALGEPQTLSAVGYWDGTNAVHQQMDTDQRASTSRYWKIEIFLNGTLHRTGIFQGYVAEHGVGPVENQVPVELNLVIQLSGSVTWS